jgi:hypothetical protein
MRIWFQAFAFKFNLYRYTGAQHIRPDKVVPSSAATSLVFLQNDAGAERWPVTKEKLAAVRKGFQGGRSKKKDDGAGGGGDANSDDDDDSDAADDEADEADDDEDDEDASHARRMEAARKKRAAGGGAPAGPAWDPDGSHLKKDLFFGVGSGKRWWGCAKLTHSLKPPVSTLESLCSE